MRELESRLVRSRGMRTLAAVALAALVAAPAATSKIDLSLRVATRPVLRGRPVVVYLRSGTPLAWNLKLIAVAPGRSWYDVVGVVTGHSQLAQAEIPRDEIGRASCRERV